MTALDAAEERARCLLGSVETWDVPTIRRHDLGTWAVVTHDADLTSALDGAAPVSVSVSVSAMYLVGQLHTHPWPTLDQLREDGLSGRDSPGALPGDPIAVLHGGGRVEIHAVVTEGLAYCASREVIAVERKGRAERPFVRVTVATDFCDEHGDLVARYREHVLLREVT